MHVAMSEEKCIHVPIILGSKAIHDRKLIFALRIYLTYTSLKMCDLENILCVFLPLVYLLW